MKFTKSEKIDSEFTKAFLEKYMSLGFGNLPKKEIDILVFGLITKLDYLDGKDYYSIAKELMIEEKVVKRLILNDSLRNEKNNTLIDSMKKIKKAIFEDKTISPEFENNIIVISIENPIERRDFIYALRCVGYSFDENLNPERIKIPIYVFMTVFCRYFDDLYYTFKSKIKEKIKTDADYEKVFHDAKPLIERVNSGIKSITEPLSGLMSIANLFGIKILN